MRNRNSLWPTMHRLSVTARRQHSLAGFFLCLSILFPLSASAEQKTIDESLSQLGMTAFSAESNSVIRVGEIPDEPLRPATMQAENVAPIAEMAVTVSQSALDKVATKTNGQLSESTEARFARARSNFLADYSKAGTVQKNKLAPDAAKDAAMDAAMDSAFNAAIRLARKKKHERVTLPIAEHQAIEASSALTDTMRIRLRKLAVLQKIEKDRLKRQQAALEEQSQVLNEKPMKLVMLLDEQLPTKRLPDIALALDPTLQPESKSAELPRGWRIPMALGLGQTRSNSTQATMQAVR